MDNAMMDLIRARKSVRVFTDEPILPEEKNAILEAAFQAPTAGNQQMYTIIDITDQKLKETMAELCDHQPFIATAPLVLVFLADCQRYPDAYHAAGLECRPAGTGDLMLAVADACIAAQNSVMAAESMGISSCYIGDVLENCEDMRQALGLEGWVMPCAMLVFGHPTQQQQERGKPKRFRKEHIVCENRYHRISAEQIRLDFEERASREGTPNYDFPSMTRAFMNRKYESDFSKEMTRSVSVYLRDYKTDF